MLSYIVIYNPYLVSEYLKNEERFLFGFSGTLSSIIDVCAIFSNSDWWDKKYVLKITYIFI